MNTILGFIFFSTEIKNIGRAAVAYAVENSGLDVEQVRDLSPRNVFIRSVRKLQHDGVIEEGTDGILADRVDNEKDVVFQLSRRYVETNGVKYTPGVFIKFDKESKQIICDNPQIKRLAENLYTTLAGIYSTTDLHSLTARLIDATGSKRVLLRPGVYFLSKKNGEILEKIKSFYNALGFSYHVYPVAPDTDTKGLAQAVVNDMKASIEGIQKEIAELRASPDGVTTRIAKQRLRDLRTALHQYKELASSLGVSFKNLLKESGDAGKVLEIAEAGDDATALGALVQAGENLPGLFIDLLEASEIVPIPVGARAEVAPVMAGEE